MNSVFFFYTLALIIVCVVTASFGVATYASSRRQVFLYASGMFVFYAIEIIEIFFNEYTLQNIAFPVSEYYTITMPVTRTLVETALQTCVWACALTLVDRFSLRRLVVPPTCFLAASAAVLLLMPQGAIKQFTYYTLRQVLMLFDMGYLAAVYLRSRGTELHARLERQKPVFFVTLALLALVVLEDVYVILVNPVNAVSETLLLYLSERSISENVLMCFYAALVCHDAYRVLSIRIMEAPAEEHVSDLEHHVDEQMPFARRAWAISDREAEVLKLVVLGRSNQQIADELFLAQGTVKTHVHNILVKSGQKNREELVLRFWQCS